MQDSRSRRRFERVRERFDAALIPGRRAIRPGGIRGSVRDLDVEGLCIETDRPLPVGRRVRVSFKLPETLSQPFRGLPCKLPGRVRLVRDCDRPGTPFDVVIQWENPLSDLLIREVGHHQRTIAFIVWRSSSGIVF